MGIPSMGIHRPEARLMFRIWLRADGQSAINRIINSRKSTPLARVMIIPRRLGVLIRLIRLMGITVDYVLMLHNPLPINTIN